MPIIYTPTVGAGLPAVQPDLPAAARAVHLLPGPRPDRASPAQPAPPRGRRDRRDRRAAHPRPGRPGRRRHGHPDRQAVALHRCRRHRPRPAPCRSCSTSAPTTPSGSTTRMYLGWRHRRIGGDDYDEFVEEFVAGGARPSCPTCCCSGRTSPPPTRCRSWTATATSCCTFNDDIQGTAAVALGGAARRGRGDRRRGWPSSSVVMLGAGSAGIGVCEQIVAAMVADGLSEQARRARIWVVDVRGLLTDDRDGPQPGPAPLRPARRPGAGWRTAGPRRLRSGAPRRRRPR